MLTPYSKDIAKHLRHRLPECASRLQEHSEGYLSLSIPTGSADLFAEVTTAEDEITLYVDRWHTHMGMEHDTDPDAEVSELIALLRDLESGAKVVTVWLSAGEWAGSGLTPGGVAPEQREGTEAYTITWSGVRTSYHRR